MQAETRVGDTARVTRRYTAKDLADFAALAGLPAGGLDQVPEPLVGALFSYLLGVKVPGPGTNYLKQEIAFSGPVPLGEDLTASVTVTRLRSDKHLCDLATVLTGPDGRRLAEGRALVLIRDVGTAAHG
ncbi:MAG: MaoC-like dehydratase [Xanthobacteraceae bacterium]|nr:MAG: MaoC-like dehydratase [Xanthobacteraceae bacterium]